MDKAFLTPDQIFSWLKNEAKFKHTGLGADYLVDVNNVKKQIVVAFDKTSTGSKFDWLINLCFMPLTIITAFVAGAAFSFFGILKPVFIILAIIEIVLTIYTCIKWQTKTLFNMTIGKFKCHTGLALVYTSIQEKLFKEVTYLKAKTMFPIVVYGWSQGGGMAQLFAADYYLRTNEQVTVTTFGALRTAWLKSSKKVLDKALTENSKLYENSSDIVPKMPLKVWGFKSSKYIKHIGKKFNWLKIFNTAKYHTAYDNRELYE